jgi:hypothetical protein
MDPNNDTYPNENDTCPNVDNMIVYKYTNPNVGTHVIMKYHKSQGMYATYDACTQITIEGATYSGGSNLLTSH